LSRHGLACHANGKGKNGKLG